MVLLCSAVCLCCNGVPGDGSTGWGGPGGALWLGSLSCLIQVFCLDPEVLAHHQHGSFGSSLSRTSPSALLSPTPTTAAEHRALL